jgi:hypothetical protein
LGVVVTPSGEQKLFSILEMGTDKSDPEQYIDYPIHAASFNYDGTPWTSVDHPFSTDPADYENVWFGQLVGDGQQLDTFSLVWDGGGFGPGFLGGSTMVFVEQAKELNIGLVFQDGQWTPAHNFQ